MDGVLHAKQNSFPLNNIVTFGMYKEWKIEKMSHIFCFVHSNTKKNKFIWLSFMYVIVICVSTCNTICLTSFCFLHILYDSGCFAY